MWGRWEYWANIVCNGTIGDEPIPYMPWVRSSSTEPGKWGNLPHELCSELGSPDSASKQIQKVFDNCYQHGATLLDLAEWLLWAFGSTSVDKRPSLPEHAAVTMYHQLQLELMVAHPIDWGEFLARDYYSKSSKQRSGWFATPIDLARLMCEMTFHDFTTDGRDSRAVSVNEPCVGTGVILLCASNHSLNLSGQDVDIVMCRLCELNAYLHVPWLVGGQSLVKELNGDMDTPVVTPSKTQLTLF
tara:strand:+ start:475 stop:1206 length:732 start_codon:yes stop_codon:yes gene_type:complete